MNRGVIASNCILFGGCYYAEGHREICHEQTFNQTIYIIVVPTCEFRVRQFRPQRILEFQCPRHDQPGPGVLRYRENPGPPQNQCQQYHRKDVYRSRIRYILRRECLRRGVDLRSDRSASRPLTLAYVLLGLWLLAIMQRGARSYVHHLSAQL